MDDLRTNLASVGCTTLHKHFCLPTYHCAQEEQKERVAAMQGQSSPTIKQALKEEIVHHHK